MVTEMNGSFLRFENEGFTSLFNLDEAIRSKVDITKLKEMAFFNHTPSLREVDDVLTRDVARIMIPEIINEQIQTKVEEKRIGRNLVRTMRVGSPTFIWMEEGKFQAERVSEGAEIPKKHLTWKTHSASVFKTGVSCAITREMVQDSRIDMIARHIDHAAIAMARYEDWAIFLTLNAGVPNNTAINDDGEGGIGTEVVNHRYKMGPNDTGNALTWPAISKILVLARQENVELNTMVINPIQMHDIMIQEQFIGATEKTWLTLPESLTRAMSTGTIGNFGGMNVVVSNNQPAGQCLMFDREVYGVLAERIPVSIDKYEDVLKQIEGVALSQRYSPVAIGRDSAFLLTAGRTAIVA